MDNLSRKVVFLTMVINRRMLLQMIDKVVPQAPVDIMGVFYRWDYSNHEGFFAELCPEDAIVQLIITI